MEIAPPPLRSRRVLTIHAGVIPARGRNTYSYTTAPKTPPRSGPSQYTHQLSKKPEATAGPSHRPGLIAAPVKYPPKSQSTPTVSPIGIAPRVFAAPRGSMAVAKTTNTTRNVIRSSSSIPPSGVSAVTAGGAPGKLVDTLPGESPRRTAPTSSPIAFLHQPASVRPASLREGRALFMVLYSIERIINGCTDPGLRDVPRVPPVEVGHELELQGFRLPRSVRIHNVREESTYIVGDLRDEMIFAEQGAADVEGEGAAAGLVDEPEGVEVLMKEDVERVELVEVGLRVADPHEGDLVHHDHVRRDDVERAEPAVRIVAQIREGEHETTAGAA